MNDRSHRLSEYLIEIQLELAELKTAADSAANDACTNES